MKLKLLYNYMLMLVMFSLLMVGCIESEKAKPVSGKGTLPPISKGSIDTKEGACDKYAKAFVAQNEANKKWDCNNFGPRWNSDESYHYKWCMQVDDLKLVDLALKKGQIVLEGCKNSKSKSGTLFVEKFIENGENDTQEEANYVRLAEIIEGSLATLEDQDWFKLKSGPPGPWGYGIEITVRPKDLPDSVDLRVTMEGYIKASNAVGLLTQYSDNKPFTLWTTHSPRTDIYLKVDAVRSTSSEKFKKNYTLNIVRFEIDDTNEDDNDFINAKEIKLSNGEGEHNTSYLCNIFKGGEDIGMEDYYFFKPDNATQIDISVKSPSLDKGNNDNRGPDQVRVYLYDNTKGHKTSNYGNTTTANINYVLPKDETAFGKWYIKVSNGAGFHKIASVVESNISDPMPLSCKRPYTIKVIAK